MSSGFKFTDYDVVGFDLDNTLLQYNLSKLFHLQYDFLSNYLVEEKGYSRKCFPSKLSDEDADFFQRGLFLDFSRGNILYLRYDGYILKASHGTKLLQDEVIESIYGKCRIWPVITPFIKDRLSLWDSNETRAFWDFTDSISSLIFAKAVDSCDLEGKPEEYQVWPDLLEAIVEMYKKDSKYIETIASDMFDFMDCCDESIISWLKDLKQHAKLILITGAEKEIGQVTMPYCFGSNFMDIFDLVVYDAKKPGFFTKNRPFHTLDGKKVDKLSLNNQYRFGNWQVIQNTFKELLGKDPKCVYIGDNPIQDVHTPTIASPNLHTIAVLEEVASEGLSPDIKDYPHSKYVSSKFWGPFLQFSGTDTIVGDIIRNSAKLVIPSIKALAKKPITFEHSNIFV